MNGVLGSRIGGGGGENLFVFLAILDEVGGMA